jgi:tetratricopeptide (TPR) repeat protein
METSFQIARTMSYTGSHEELSISEYQNAIEMAQKQGSQETLKKIYLELISAFVDVRMMTFSGPASQFIENYMALDKSNARVYACLGVVRFQEGDYPGAIEAFQTSLSLEDDRVIRIADNSPSYVGIALLQTMFTMRDYSGMMSEIERYGASTIGFWFRESMSDMWFQRRVMYAARKAGQFGFLLNFYQQQTNNSQFSENDLRAIKDSEPATRAQLKLSLRSMNLAISSMFRCILGWLYYKYLGQPEEAIELWKIAFFQRSEFIKLGNILSSNFTTDIIPQLFADFSQLLYQKALLPNGEVDKHIITLLESLRQRHQDFRHLDRDRDLTDQRNLNLLLAKLYWRCGRNDEARKLLNEQFQRAIELLQDDIGWNDAYGYEILTRLLFTNGQEGNAKLAASLRRFFCDGYDVEGHITKGSDYDPRRPLPISCAGFCGYSDGPQVEYDTPLYTCTTCANVDFCEGCYDSLHNQTGGDKIFVCNPNHDFIKSPAEGLECIKDDMVTMNGRTLSFTAWFDEVQKEWKTGLYFQT